MILLTGRGNHEVDLAAMEAGVADYLDKDECRLLSQVGRILELNGPGPVTREAVEAAREAGRPARPARPLAF